MGSGWVDAEEPRKWVGGGGWVRGFIAGRGEGNRLGRSVGLGLAGAVPRGRSARGLDRDVRAGVGATGAWGQRVWVVVEGVGTRVTRTLGGLGPAANGRRTRRGEAGWGELVGASVTRWCHSRREEVVGSVGWAGGLALVRDVFCGGVPRTKGSEPTGRTRAQFLVLRRFTVPCQQAWCCC